MHTRVGYHMSVELAQSNLPSRYIGIVSLGLASAPTSMCRSLANLLDCPPS